jgi:hypothetical protein
VTSNLDILDIKTFLVQKLLPEVPSDLFHMERQEANTAEEQQGTAEWSPENQEGVVPFLSVSEAEKWKMQLRSRSNLIKSRPGDNPLSNNLLQIIGDRDHVCIPLLYQLTGIFQGVKH